MIASFSLAEQPIYAASFGQQPNAAPVAATATGFTWPSPPYAAYAKAEPWSEPQVCEIEGLNGAIRICKLVSMTPSERTLLIQIENSKTPMPLAFSQFRRLTLMQAIASQEVVCNAQFDGILHYRPTVQYTLQLGNGSTVSGSTVGHVETDYGLFVFKPLDEQGTVERIFVPREAFSSVTLGDHIGQMLINQNTVTAQQVEFAATEQDSLRTRKLGDYLVENAVVSPEQLMMALDQQSKMPMIRVGEALTRLGYIDDAQLAQALEKQKIERSVPLGQLLVNMGFLARADLNTALARKMGYPMVDVTQFPVDIDALRKIPKTTAQRLNIMPLLWRDKLLVVAAIDPTLRKML